MTTSPENYDYSSHIKKNKTKLGTQPIKRKNPIPMGCLQRMT